MSGRDPSRGGAGAPAARTDGARDGAAASAPDAPALVSHWTRVLAATNGQLAAQFVARAPAALRRLGPAGIEDWVVAALEAFDQQGLGAALAVLDGIEAHAARREEAGRACRLEQQSRFLSHLVCGLGGRPLAIAAETTASTDTERIYLPPVLAELDSPAENARLYKCLAVFLWAQNRFGTWRYRTLEAAMSSLDEALAWPVYQRLECVRIEACLGRELPGLAREMARLGFRDAAHRAGWAALRGTVGALADPAATARDSLGAVAGLIGHALPPLPRYAGEMYPARVREVMGRRVTREQAALQEALAELGRQAADGEPASPADEGIEAAERFSVSAAGPAGAPATALKLRRNGTPVPLRAELGALLESMIQDHGELGPEDLASAPYPAEAEGADPESAGSDAGAPGEASFVYPEWDHTRQRFRERFCTVVESIAEPGDEAFIGATRAKYRGLARSLRRAFEAVVAEAERQRRQPHGDELDLDALVEAHADRCQGRELSDRVYTHFRQFGRSVAVMFMVDMSGSTKGWINDAEREALILLTDALDALGDTYAIQGFSGRTNKRCEIYSIKRFDEPCSLEVGRRIAGMTPRAYTRMGAAIRHLGAQLAAVPARSKLLIALSDGKPEDYGSYRGAYGIEDTRHALLEVRQCGIHPFCITIDREAQSYLPHMYGRSGYAVVDDVRKLPQRVAEVYRRLAT